MERIVKEAHQRRRREDPFRPLPEEEEEGEEEEDPFDPFQTRRNLFPFPFAFPFPFQAEMQQLGNGQV